MSAVQKMLPGSGNAKAVLHGSGPEYLSAVRRLAPGHGDAKNVILQNVPGCMKAVRRLALRAALYSAGLSALYLFAIMPRPAHRRRSCQEAPGLRGDLPVPRRERETLWPSRRRQGHGSAWLTWQKRGRAPAWRAFGSRLFAHRGLHGRFTGFSENSLPAIRRAAEEGYGIEFDVQVTKDGVPVIFHDFTLQRMCGAPGKVCDYTLRELRRFCLREPGTGERIPTLAQALRAVGGRVPLIIELKVEYCDLRVCRAADRLLRDYRGPYCVESFNPLVLLWYRTHRPDVMRGQLSDGFLHMKEFRTPVKLLPSFFIQHLFTNCVTRPDFIAYNHMYQGNPSRRLAHVLFRAGEAAWTVRSEEELKRAARHFDVFIFENFLPKKETLRNS